MTHPGYLCAFLFAAASIGEAAQPAPPTETVIRLRLSPVRAPRPALKYHLIPELAVMNQGNPVPAFMKCFMEQQHFFHNKEAVAERERLQKMPLEELAAAHMRNYGGERLRQADYAARLDAPDWQALTQLKSEGINMLLPDVQEMRTLGSALRVRLRAEIAGHHFEDALRTVQTLFALARIMGEHPTLIGGLVGQAIATITIESVEEMISQPGCPSLFWALTDLPHPLIELRKGVQGERIFLANEFGMLDEKKPMTEKQLETVMNRYDALGIFFPSDAHTKKLSGWAKEMAADRGFLKAARQKLIDSGIASQSVEHFPAVQVVLLDGKITYQIQRDDLMKAMAIPYWQAAPLLAGSQPKSDSPFSSLIVSMPAVRRSHARGEQRLALLRCAEALRLFAADHEGKLPATLSEVTLPLPIDPITGTSLEYHVEAGVARLRGAAPRGMEKNAAFNVRYEITVSK